MGAKTRCPWCGDDPLYVSYHDEEWGVPVHDDSTLFEFLTLEGAQAGLSWITVLRKRENYRRWFHDWDILRIAEMTDGELEAILLDSGVVRNRLKIFSVRKNAQVALGIKENFGSLDAYFWSEKWFYNSSEKARQGGVLQKGISQSVILPHSPVSGKGFRHQKYPSDLMEALPNFPVSGRGFQHFPLVNHGENIRDFPTYSDISDAISKDLKKRGMSFVGSTIIYAFMQAVGMVDDHIDACFCKGK